MADKTKRKDDSAAPDSTTYADRDNSVPILMHRSIDRLRSRPFKDREIVKEKSIFQKEIIIIINKIEEQRGNRTFMETMAALGCESRHHLRVRLVWYNDHKIKTR